MKFIRLFKTIVLVTLATFSSLSLAQNTPESEMIRTLKREIDSGIITFLLTEEKEIIELLGNPDHEKASQEGGLFTLNLFYPDIEIFLGKRKREERAPFILYNVKINDQFVDIGRNRQITLRGNHDLSKLDGFNGFQNVSLKNVNLREEEELVQRMTFDNLTEWPSKENLPQNFDPLELLNTHKTPGLKIKELHAQGVTGKGVGIAIVDQPLLLGHEEYTSQIIRYDASGLLDLPPQMHGSPIASIAVGKNIGVAPEASLSYFAVPMWENDNLDYIKSLEKIIRLNEILPNDEKIRVVSISDGNFSSKPHFSEWQNILKRSEELGIFVVTCDPEFLEYGTLYTVEGKDPDKINNYTRGRYASDKDVLLIPAGNRTLASHQGIDVYVFDRRDGMSWAAPYLAGLAALAFQINPKLAPDEIKELLMNSSTRTSAGPVIDPIQFIENAENHPD